MKTPKFWYKKKTLLSLALLPLSGLWMLVSYLRNKLKKKHYFNIPIICIGNAIAGGGGKTPLILELCKQYRSKKISVHVVYKAYKTKIVNKAIKINQTHTFEDVGDEPILISKHATTWVCKHRKDGINAAINNNADLILLDDGLQDNTIYKNLNILVANETQGNGNGLVIPAGPLRERISTSLQKSDFMFFYGNKISAKKLFYKYEKKIFTGNIVTDISLLNLIKENKVIAFAGIAHPDNFFKLLSKYKLKLIKKLYFPDHYIYSKKDILKIINISKSKSAKIVTTSKDYTKIPDDLKKYITVIQINVNFEKELLLNFINKKIDFNV
jgi:tetraacyldisaccharide 4'-kinase